ncbi:hypothetical protein AZSI13_28830 [Azospira sp. I13]|uniref:DUF3617 domain-containing protein n=1 Tax=Azospira sp. I13 TaxID=1765050 RepID=UPI000D3F17F5|nr:DUF3617 family protein [Azospira sp. I13]GBG03556.1 hypothetical protein AZSI13_28830 [Azospira sp. I13]
MRSTLRPSLLLSTLMLLGLGLPLAASAGDLPKRKSGLWEIRTQMAGAPSMGPMKICVDEAKDNLMQEQPGQKPDCSVMDVKPGNGKVTIHTVCRMEQTTVTTDGTMTGDFSSGYKSDMTMRYSPPMHGMAEMRVTQESRWVGPCAKGQKPGDVIMPQMGGGPGNGQGAGNDMMNDPRVREMMKRQRQ